MIGIVPIVLGRQADFWLHRRGWDLLSKTIQRLDALDDLEELILSTDTPEAQSRLEAHGLECVSLPQPCEAEKLEILPAGTRETLEAVSERLRPAESALCILDFRNPFIDSEIVRRACDRYRTGGSQPLFSFTEVIDHPCQLNLYTTIVEAGLLHFFEPELDLESGRYRSRPYAFDWKLNASQNLKPGTRFALCFAKAAAYFKRLDPSGPAETSLEILEFVDAHLARSLLRLPGRGIENADRDPLGCAEGDLVGAAVMGSSLLAVATRNHRGTWLQVGSLLREKGDQRFLLSVAPLGLGAKATENEIAGPPLSLRLPDTYSKATGLVYELARIVNAGEYYCSRPVTAERGGWALAADGTRRLTGIPERQILGRQDFPPLIEHVKGLAILPIETVRFGLGNELLQGCIPYRLPLNKSLRVENELDLLRYEANKRAAVS